MATKFNLAILKGRTLNQPLRWEAEPFLFAKITDVSQSAPIVVTTETTHSIPVGWRVAVVGVQGMTLLNARGNPPATKDFRKVRVPSPTTVEFNALSSADEAPYSGGGYLQWYSPVSLAGAIARMSIKDEAGGLRMSLTSLNSKLVVDDANKVIRISLPATETAALAWESGVYDLEVETVDGTVTALFEGTVSVVDEITT